MLKALAFEGRGENKDAYDLVYLLQNYGNGVEDVLNSTTTTRMPLPLQRAITISRAPTVDAMRPLRLAEFLGNEEDDVIAADAAGAVYDQLMQKRRCR